MGADKLSFDAGPTANLNQMAIRDGCGSARRHLHNANLPSPVASSLCAASAPTRLGLVNPALVEVALNAHQRRLQRRLIARRWPLHAKVRFNPYGWPRGPRSAERLARVAGYPYCPGGSRRIVLVAFLEGSGTRWCRESELELVT